MEKQVWGKMGMIKEDFFEMKLGDVLEKYQVLYNLECGYFYGICDSELVDKMYEEYRVEDYEVAVSPEPLIQLEVLDEMQGELLTEEQIGRIMSNLGIKHR